MICFSVMTWPTLAVSLSMATALACTSTASVSPPVWRSRSTRTTWSTFRRTPVRLAGRKPWSDAVTEYVLTGSSGMTKLPSFPLIASRFEPVSSLVAVTVTPGTTAPVASFTVPVIWPVAD